MIFLRKQLGVLVKKIAWYLNAVLFPPCPQIEQIVQVDSEAQKWTAAQKRHSIYQMRINYTGEICAQALYIGHQGFVQDDSVSRWLERAQKEEMRHLEWCKIRLEELQGTPSRLNGFFYMGSYLMASALSRWSPAYNLAFIEETEKQVYHHLSSQLETMTYDLRSSAVIEKMRKEEMDHALHARSYHPPQVPYPVKKMMNLLSWGMKILVYYV